MKHKHKFAAAAIAFTLTGLALGGGTFAWFQISNTANLALTGTIIGVKENLQVGFRFSDELTIDDQIVYGLIDDEYEVSGLGYVYWTTRPINANFMKFVVEKEGYAANNRLVPVTSGSFSPNDAINLYRRPEHNTSRRNRLYPIDEISSINHYVGFDILFRMSEQDGLGNSVGLQDYGIFFDENTSFIGTNNVTEALRLGFTNGINTNIIAPDANTDGFIDVGGVMDLNGDGAFDYTSQHYSLGPDGPVLNPIYEIAYGEFDDNLTDDNWTEPSGSFVGTAGSNDLFYVGESFMSARPLINATPKTASYSTINHYQTGNNPLALTNEDGIADLSFYIWLEGWDHACTNSVANAVFAAVITFAALELNP